MARLFRRRAPRERGPQVAPAQKVADALRELGSESDPPVQVVAPTNNIHTAPTQHHVIESMITRPGGLVAVLESVSQCSQLVPPGAVDRPTPLEVPVTGHNLVLSLINRSDGTVTVTDLRAVYTWIAEYEFPAQLKALSSASVPPLVLSEDLRPAAEDSASGYRPLESPHYEVHLDGVRPLIVEALLPDGERPREHVPVPLSLTADETTRIVLAPVTTLPFCIGWRLLVRWQEDDADLYAAWDLTVTGFTGWALHTSGAEPRPSPVADLGHWDPHSYYEGGHTGYDEHLTMTVQTNPAWLEAVRQADSPPPLDEPA